MANSGWGWLHAEIALWPGKNEVTEVREFLIGNVPFASLRPPPLPLAISWDCTEVVWILFLSQECLRKRSFPWCYPQMWYQTQAEHISQCWVSEQSGRRTMCCFRPSVLASYLTAFSPGFRHTLLLSFIPSVSSTFPSSCALPFPLSAYPFVQGSLPVS